MACSIATIVYLLGYMPPKGTVITIPKSQAEQYTAAQIARAKRCAQKYGIGWRIEDAR